MRRQFLLASVPLRLDEFCCQSFGSWWLYCGAETRISVDRHICLIGLAADVDTAEPAVAADLEPSLAQGGLEALVDHSDLLVGRLLIVVNHRGRLLVVPDGWCSLQAFWAREAGGPAVLSSSPALLRDLGFGSTTSCDASRLHDESEARALEYRSVGDICPVSGTKRVRSSHLLDLSAGIDERLPLGWPGPRRTPAST